MWDTAFVELINKYIDTGFNIPKFISMSLIEFLDLVDNLLEKVEKILFPIFFFNYALIHRYQFGNSKINLL